MHKTEIISQKQISDKGIAVTIRCCGNPKSDSTLTIQNAASLRQDALEKLVDKKHDLVKASCEQIRKHSESLVNIKNKTKTHDGVEVSNTPNQSPAAMVQVHAPAWKSSPVVKETPTNETKVSSGADNGH